NRDALAKLGLDEAGLDALARKNLKDALKTLPHAPIAPGSRIFRVQAGDDYEASRLLVPELWGEAARTVAGALVASAPCRHIVLFTGGAHPEDVAALRKLSEQLVATEHHPISSAVLRWNGQGWAAQQP